MNNISSTAITLHGIFTGCILGEVIDYSILAAIGFTGLSYLNIRGFDYIVGLLKERNYETLSTRK